MKAITILNKMNVAFDTAMNNYVHRAIYSYAVCMLGFTISYNAGIVMLGANTVCLFGELMAVIAYAFRTGDHITIKEMGAFNKRVIAFQGIAVVHTFKRAVKTKQDLIFTIAAITAIAVTIIGTSGFAAFYWAMSTAYVAAYIATAYALEAPKKEAKETVSE